MKIHGGVMASNWANAAMALHRLEGFEQRMEKAKSTAAGIFAALNTLPGFKVTAIPEGSNVFTLDLSKDINATNLRDKLYNEYNIRIGMPDGNNHLLLFVNDTLVHKDQGYIINAFKKSLTKT